MQPEEKIQQTVLTKINKEKVINQIYNEQKELSMSKIQKMLKTVRLTYKRQYLENI